jgi:aerobic-type carbon monoxide dehydrogenase small subunit (CoxS/CutS family)
MKARDSCERAETNTSVLIEPRQITQNICHCCAYYGVCSIHVGKRRFLCCWLVTEILSDTRITTYWMLSHSSEGRDREL